MDTGIHCSTIAEMFGVVHYAWIVQNEWTLYMDSKNEFAVSIKSWIHYVWISDQFFSDQ